MGGRAFLQVLPPGSLPRLPTPLYVALKARLTALLLTLFSIVKVPPERPEKEDHGDIDFIVACPLSDNKIAPELVGHVLGAVKSIELDGNRTSNYAIAIDQEVWLAHSAKSLPSDDVYCQVDVKVCDDEQAVERMVIFHGYGDLGIIIGAMAKSHGLTISHNGLKVTSPPPHPPILLTGSPRDIFDFMGLSIDRWMEGFETVEETFEFAITSRFFKPRRLNSSSDMSAFNKSVQGRGMYADFLLWAQGKPPATTRELHRDTVEEALVLFGKKSEWDGMAQQTYERTWLKNNFNGKLVAEWTGLGWKGVKAVMDDVRSSVGEQRALVGMEPDQLKNLVMMSQRSLKLDA